MAEKDNLESLYTQAQQALKAKDYDRAASLLKQILIADENYKDASRLLARIVHEKRRRWYNDVRIWGTVVAVIVIGVLIWLAPKLPLEAMFAPATIVSSPTATAIPTKAATPTITPSPTPTPIPLTWKRIYIGQEFQRDNVTTIVVDPKDSDVIYVGTENAGIYKSINGGHSWQPAFSGLGQSSIKNLAINPENPNILYAVTGNGLYMTTNNARSWQAAVLEMGSGMVIDPNDSMHIYYMQFENVYESFDGGKSWKEVKTSLCPNEAGSPVIHPRDGQSIFASQGSSNKDCRVGVYVSRDAGRTWNYLGLEYDYLSLAVSLDAEGSEIIYAVQTGGNAKIYVTRDGGQNWEDSFPSIRLCGGSLWVNPSDFNVAFYWSRCGPTGLWATMDAGQSWHEVPALHLKPVTALASSQEGSRIVVGGEGVYISIDAGKTWEERSNGLGAGRLQLEIDPINSKVLYVKKGCSAGETCYYYRSADGGRAWSEVTLDGGSLSFIDVGADGTLYSAFRGTMWYSKNGGGHWEPLSIPWHLQSVFASPYVPGFIVVFTDSPPYIGVTTDAGQTWQAASGYQGGGRSVIFNPSDRDQVYLVTLRHQVYQSQDGGKTWEFTQEGVWNPRSETWRVFNPQDSNYVVSLGPQQGVYISTDGGQTWREQDEGLGNLYVNSLAIDPRNPDTLYAGTDSGAYVSFDSGKMWHQINDGLLGATVVYSIMVDKDSNVYAATPYGIFRLENK